MGTILYYLMTFAEAGLGVIGIRGLYEQPRYSVVEQLQGSVEVRDYLPRVAAETDDDGSGRVAFQRLFRYIAGANATGTKIAMTAPVAQDQTLIAMTVPVQSTKSGGVMRFFLPREVVAKGPPQPLDDTVRIVTVKAERLAVLRFSGIPDRSSVEAHDRLLLAALARTGQTVQGAPFLLTYDAPFTIPFVRRNEVAVNISVPNAPNPEQIPSGANRHPLQSG